MTLETTLITAAIALFCRTCTVDCSSSYALLAYSVRPMNSMASAVYAMTGAPAAYFAGNRNRLSGSATAVRPATAGTAISRYSRTP